MKFIVKLFMILEFYVLRYWFLHNSILLRTEIKPKETLSEKQDIKKENNPIRKSKKKTEHHQ
jgi:hypothetical protein